MWAGYNHIMTNPNQLYDSYYYRVYDGRPYERNEEWLRFFGGIAQEIVTRIGPKTVLDAGCALGFLVETLRDRKVEAYGVDISEYAIEHTHASIRPYCQAASITEPFAQKYDLIVTIEVLEHLERLDAEKAIANLCQYCDDILFSSSPYEYKDLTHINVQPPEVWAEIFARQGFFRDLDFDASFIIPWAVRFRRRSDPPQRILLEYERYFFRLHKENISLRQLGMDLQNKLAFNENLVTELRHQVEDITNSRAFRLGRQIRHLVPLGSRREKWILKILSTFGKIFHKPG